MTDREKLLFTALAVLLWGAFAYSGKTPPDEFIQFLRELIISLGSVAFALKVPRG